MMSRSIFSISYWIKCISVHSKAFENYLLDWLQADIRSNDGSEKLKKNQVSELEKHSTVHFIKVCQMLLGENSLITSYF